MSFKIEANHLSFFYKKDNILKDNNFQLEDGKIYGLLGRNGAGKTTLLSLLASFMPPQSGLIKIDGEEAFENANAMQQVAFIYETDYADEYSTLPGMLEDVALTRPFYDADYAAHLIKRFKLPLDKPIYELSRGMQAALNVTLGLASRCPITLFMVILNEQQLGNTKSIMVYGLLDDSKKQEAIQNKLAISSIALQNLFIHLTREDGLI